MARTVRLGLIFLGSAAVVLGGYLALERLQKKEGEIGEGPAAAHSDKEATQRNNEITKPGDRLAIELSLLILRGIAGALFAANMPRPS